ncbi:DUF2784 domain-containing protein [Massilia terrae]|uniref:DUF2784 domain-containing protein n=2 Tax=Massilia terrae TaxID=1811224 RepID=A0ABT2CU03_9BURK|nr:DUF2784 domain-containing protein [Massilia terrae]
MEYRIAAAGVLLLHFGFMVFVVAGAVLALRRRWVIAVHLPAAVWGFWVEAGGIACPLTYLENWLRIRGGEAGYSEGFVEHYLLAAIYPEWLTRNTQHLLAAFVLLVNVCLYVSVLRHWARHHTGSSEVPPAEEP